MKGWLVDAELVCLQAMFPIRHPFETTYGGCLQVTTVTTFVDPINQLSSVFVTIEMGLTSSTALSFLFYYWREMAPLFFSFFLLFFLRGLRGAEGCNMWRSPNTTPKNKNDWEETIQILMYNFPSAMVWLQSQNRKKNLLNYKYSIILEHQLDLTQQTSARPD